MSLTPAEQYGIELLNRARLDPAAEAARYGIGLNKGLSGADRVTAAQKQVLAPDQHLDLAATKHSSWMLNNSFSHTGAGGTDPVDRMAKAGYKFNDTAGGWSWGENLAFLTAQGKNEAKLVAIEHKMLMLSPGHRENILRNSFREIGYSQEMGTYQGYGSMITQNFAHRGVDRYVTGVVYNDKNGNNFYDVGEQRQGVKFTVDEDASATSALAGGYAVAITKGFATVSISDGDTDLGSVLLTGIKNNYANGEGNVKLDLVGRDTVFVAGNNGMAVQLLDGIDNVRLLGINGNSLTGNDADNEMVGNKGSNKIQGKGGDDAIWGAGGHDALTGGSGNDRLAGGNGRDKLSGGEGNDSLTGGTGADSFIFYAKGGEDDITDFKTGQHDKLLLDPEIWSRNTDIKNAGDVIEQFAIDGGSFIVIDFDNGQTITVHGVADEAALKNAIDIMW
jgi:Ca2+-binding RTX toxin-like protein